MGYETGIHCLGLLGFAPFGDAAHPANVVVPDQFDEFEWWTQSLAGCVVA